MRDDIERRDSGASGDDESIRMQQRWIGPVHFRAFHFGGTRRGLGGLVLVLAGVGALVLVGMLLMLGALLLTALAVGGAALGGGLLLYRRFRRALRGDAGRAARSRSIGALDPANELDAAIEIRSVDGRSRD